MKRFLLLLAVLAITIFAGCAEVETYNDAGKAIDVSVNEEFFIALGSNQTTGYSWQASYDETMLELVPVDGQQSTYKQDEESEGLLGAGGIEYFRFKALKTGRTEITLVYEQNWEGGGVGETKVFTIHIR